MFNVDPSLNVPVAVSWAELRAEINGLVGDNAIDVRVAGVTVTVAVVVCPVNRAAVMVAVPGATPVTKPVVETVAMLGALDDQEATAVTSMVKRFSRVAVAVNCWVAPAATLLLAGVIATDPTVDEETVTFAELETPPTLAVTLTGPAAKADSSPFEPAALLIEATVPSEVVQVAVVVRSWVVLSL
jgi:hypothetical protein